VEAISSIRANKAKELVGTIFMSIPCGDFDERVQLDHLNFVKVEPEVVARNLDRCATVIALFYDIHGNMVNEIDKLLEEYTDHDHVMERRSMMDREAHGSKSQFTMYTYMDGVEVDSDSLEPISSPINPNYTYVPSTGDKLNANGWEIPEAKTPIEPSGWGTDDEETIRDVYMDGEASTELYTICHEAMENEVNASQIKIEVDDVSQITCYYMEDGCLIYPIWDKEEDETMYELDYLGVLNILSTGRILTELLKHINI
jgi:hypothetical protein